MKMNEPERYHRRVQCGKIKKIQEFSDRSKRKQRKIWREKKIKSRLNKKRQEEHFQAITENTPPGTPQPRVYLQNNEILGDAQSSHQKQSGLRRARKNRKQLKQCIHKLKKKVENLTRSNATYRVRLSRLKEKQKNNLSNTPRKRVNNLLDGQHVNEKIREQILFAEVLTKQLTDNFKKIKSRKGKNEFALSITGNLMKKYRFKNVVSSILSRKFVNKTHCISNRRKKLLTEKYKLVKEFLERDEISRLCPGKNDVITKNKIKKQKRLLTDSIKNTYKMFRFAYPHTKISYSLFCKLRPFYVLSPNAKSRETCLCVIHENVLLLVSKMKLLKIINENSSSEIVNSLCCRDQTELCSERSCAACKEKTIVTNEFNSDDITSYKKWETAKVTLLIKGVEKQCQKTIKKQITCTKRELVVVLENSITKFMAHTNNIKHQYHAISEIKQNLKFADVLIPTP
ncbi:unnamed protein product [Psylliodes chrysocephalus]|uniref:Uncharacterized protein n=1 Tax=Psylliodes chrysocephalus TaxID=3402493 RepID=A0A9P0DGA2_9CUCU|nr:unnamed protein product [Psylliodes chrysocephala]